MKQNCNIPRCKWFYQEEDEWFYQEEDEWFGFTCLNPKISDPDGICSKKPEIQDIGGFVFEIFSPKWCMGKELK
jgi:hypothetical protein